MVNTTFVNYQDNERRKTGALSFLLFTSAGLTTASTIKRCEIRQCQARVFPENTIARFDNDNRGGVAYRTLAFHDLDGSVGGIPNS